MSDEDRSSICIRIDALETILRVAKIDNFHVRRRKLNSRIKHLDTTDFDKATMEGLEEYEDHLRAKLGGS